MGHSFYRLMFLGGAVWNLLGGVLVVILTRWIFDIADLQPPSPSAYYYSWIALFMTFGIGYLMVARDPASQKSLVLLGIIGKLAFAFVFIYSYIVHVAQIPGLFLIPVIGDLVFVVLFAMFLVSSRTKE